MINTSSPGPAPTRSTTTRSGPRSLPSGSVRRTTSTFRPPGPGAATALPPDRLRPIVCLREFIVPPVGNVASVLSRLDALVLCSDFEGFPNVVLEAMASRLPVVATRVGDVPSLIDEGGTGFVVEPRDAAGLAAALERLASLDPGAREAMGARARARVEERFRMEAVASSYLELYEELLAER